MDLPLKLTLERLANGVSPSSVSMAFADWANHLLVSPSKQAELGRSAVGKWLLWLQYGHRAWQGECAACAQPLPPDKRFSRPGGKRCRMPRWPRRSCCSSNGGAKP